MAEVVAVSAVTDRYPVVEIGNIPTVRAKPVEIAGLQIPSHDYIGLSYTGSNLTGVVYKVGGASGSVVATLVLAYSGSNLISVTSV